MPGPSFLTGRYPQEYIQLSNGSLGGGDQYIRAGIESCVVAKSFGYTCTPGSGLVAGWPDRRWADK